VSNKLTVWEGKALYTLVLEDSQGLIVHLKNYLIAMQEALVSMLLPPLLSSHLHENSFLPTDGEMPGLAMLGA